MPYLLCYETSLTLLKLAFIYQEMGARFMAYSLYSVMAGWIAEMFFMLFFAYIAM